MNFFLDKKCQNRDLKLSPNDEIIGILSVLCRSCGARQRLPGGGFYIWAPRPQGPPSSLAWDSNNWPGPCIGVWQECFATGFQWPIQPKQEHRTPWGVQLPEKAAWWWCHCYRYSVIQTFWGFAGPVIGQRFCPIWVIVAMVSSLHTKTHKKACRKRFLRFFWDLMN